MTWGQAFRSAWEHAGSSSRSAAREAALSPEKAAGILSDAIAHSLQLVLFAAQDVQRIEAAGASASTGDNTSPMPALRRVMEDIRQGRIPPEKSEKHLQQAARSMVQQAQAMQGMSADKPAVTNDIQLAVQRFNDQRKKLTEQLVMVHEARMKESSVMVNGMGADQSGLTHNVAFVGKLAQAFASIDELFLDKKRVDNPAAPLPPPT